VWFFFGISLKHWFGGKSLSAVTFAQITVLGSQLKSKHAISLAKDVETPKITIHQPDTICLI